MSKIILKLVRASLIVAEVFMKHGLLSIVKHIYL